MAHYAMRLLNKINNSPELWINFIILCMLCWYVVFTAFVFFFFSLAFIYYHMEAYRIVKASK